MAGEDFLGDDLDLEQDDEQGDEQNELDNDESIDALRQSIEDSYDDTPAKKKVDTDDRTKIGEIADETFFSGDADELEDLIKDPKTFNKLLNDVYRKGVEISNTRSNESMLLAAPGIIKQQVSEQIALQRSVTRFYETNEDLVPYKKTVAAIANKVASENPEFTLKEVFKETEKLSRARLKLAKKASENNDKGKRFPSKPNGRRNTAGDKIKDEHKSSMTNQIDDMLDALKR